MKTQLYMKNPSLYDLFTFGTKALQKRQRFYLKQVRNGKEILEIGAGTGSLSLYLAGKGKSITCIEPSHAAFINLSAKVFNSANYKTKVTLLPMKISQVRFKKRFDHIIISNVMPYVHPENERNDLLQRAKRSAITGCKLIITFFSDRTAVKKKKKFDAKIRIGSGFIYRYSENLPLASQNFRLTKFTWSFDSYCYGRQVETVKEDFVLRCDKKYYVEQLLNTNGWSIDSIFTDYDDSCRYDQSTDSGIMIVIATLRGAK